MSKEHAALARKNAWSPEARAKRKLTMQRKKAANASTEVMEEQLTALAEAVPKTRKPYTKKAGNGNAVAIQLLEMVIKLLKE